VFFAFAAFLGITLAGSVIVGCVAALLITIIGATYINIRFPDEVERQAKAHRHSERRTDGVYESATEKLDKGLPLNEREKKRVYDILTSEDKRRAEEIERKNGERP